MTQERMHPDDLRAIVASNMWGGGMPLEWAMKSADLLFAELARTAKPEDEPEFLAWRQKAWDNASRAEKAEARVEELESYVSVLVHGERNNDLVFALWNETCGGASADKAAADLRSMITDLDNSLNNSKARVKELEDAIREHRNVHSKMPSQTRYEYELWAKVK